MKLPSTQHNRAFRRTSQKMFNEIQTLKRRILPDERVVLFGSRARGDAREDSDWDLLVLLNKDKKNYIEDYDRYAYPFAEIGLKYEAVVSIRLFTTHEWKNKKLSLFIKMWSEKEWKSHEPDRRRKKSFS